MRKLSFVITLGILMSSLSVAQTVPQLKADNIDQVVKAMTLQEKAALLVGLTRGNAYFGLPTATDANSKVLVDGAAGETKDISRLGIPVTVVADGPAGLRINPTRQGESKTYYCTGFPVATLLASTWNTSLVNEVGKAMGNEVREYGVDVLLAPAMNIHRNPLCGRNFEYYSEDPFLAGNICAAMVNGVQSNGVGTSVKHFAGNNQESNRMANDARMSQRALREIYLKGFEIVVKESQPWTIMSSYNMINGTFTQESRDLLTTILRDEWGFKGIVMTDWTGKRNTAAQVHAGNDLMMPGNKTQVDDILSQVKDGNLSEADIDLCVKRMLEYIVKTPRFKGYKFSNAPDLKAHAEITRNSAAEGMILLKNENEALPLKAGQQNIALFGVTSYDFIAGGTGSGHVNKAYVIDLLQGLTNAGFGVNEQLKDLYKNYMNYQKSLSSFDKKDFWAFLSKSMIPEMTVDKKVIDGMAQSAEMAVITIGRNAGEGADRKIDNDFNLTDNERSMISNICNSFHAVGKKVVVILNIGGVIETASWKMMPDAILLAWQAGQEGGNTVADVLKGTVNPSGKLPMTFPLNYLDHPSSLNFPYDYVSNPLADFGFTMPGAQKQMRKNIDYTNYDEDIWVGYRYFNTSGKAVSYPFGYGLSYTTFAYSGAKITPSANGFVASITVKNTGKVAGKEVVEVYISAPKGKLEKPASELKAFAKTKSLAPGESETLTMSFSTYDMASFDEAASAWITDAGQYSAKFGASVEDIKASVPFTVKKENIVKANNVMVPAPGLTLLKLK
ncbi:MAG TPA: glycoside hydrolase family 3 N-terminal domain-containing protein [Bacteroidales bacterium]|nr:glycoside hydrolase family 3 N-terminal domain-containing protein [Bacteroidales bacterium]